jgi:hypothetical protein
MPLPLPAGIAKEFKSSTKPWGAAHARYLVRSSIIKTIAWSAALPSIGVRPISSACNARKVWSCTNPTCTASAPTQPPTSMRTRNARHAVLNGTSTSGSAPPAMRIRFGINQVNLAPVLQISLTYQIKIHVLPASHRATGQLLNRDALSVPSG